MHMRALHMMDCRLGGRLLADHELVRLRFPDGRVANQIHESSVILGPREDDNQRMRLACSAAGILMLAEKSV
jgi:hypothetical protein